MKLYDLQNEVEKRLEKKGHIRGKINAFCEKEYGISDFSGLADAALGSQQGLGIYLARQISNANIEHVALHLFAEWLTDQGVQSEAIPISLVKDVFSGVNRYKKSLVSIPYLSRSNKGRLFCQHDNILAREQKMNLDGRILEDLQTKTGQTLPDFHHDLRGKILGDGLKRTDISKFFLECLSYCLRNKRGRPAYVFIDDGEGRERRIHTSVLNGHSLLRPTPDWFYLFHLLLFMDGTRCMVSTVGDNNTVSRWFSESREKISLVTGLSPLIIDIPCEVEAAGVRSDLNHINKGLFSSGWKEKVRMPENNPTLFSAFEFLERQVIEM